MGIVAAALHVQLDQRVAIKLLLPDSVSNPDAARALLARGACGRHHAASTSRAFIDVGDSTAANRTSSWSTSRARPRRAAR